MRKFSFYIRNFAAMISIGIIDLHARQRGEFPRSRTRLLHRRAEDSEDSMMNLCERDIQRSVRAIDPRWRLLSIRALSSRASELHVATGAETETRLILLTHSQHDRERDPHIARHEFQLLKVLKATGLPTPDSLFLCETHQPPFLITAFVEGAARLDAAHIEANCRRLAEALNAIHSLELSEYELSFLPHIDDAINKDRAPRTTEQLLIHKAMQRALPRVTLNAPALLHGDFWPGNLLWNGDELAAIIDWEDAMLGDPLADLGKSRLEILWALGPETMNLYSAHYLALNHKLNTSALPFWDLWGASRLSHYPSFAPAPEAVPRMRAQYDGFVADAIGRLEAR